MAVIHDELMAKKFHQVYSGKFPSKFEDVLPAYFGCNIISQDVHMILNLSVDQ